ncbi:hypothetical protein H0X32_00120 [Patescibacteria group bacterium]|nr:hypothetical protein [Patescibacteria group bacterium]
MKRKRFNLMHSIVGIALLVVVEAGILFLFGNSPFTAGVIVFFSLGGALGIVIISTEVIREVRNADHMLFLLSAVITEFIVFFAFQYWYFSVAMPGSFQGLVLDPPSLLLNSIMIFALNPLYLPLNAYAKALLLVNTLGALSIVLFVLQNIWQFRSPRQSQDSL